MKLELEVNDIIRDAIKAVRLPELGFKNMPVRFFINSYNESEEDDITEVDEAEFLESEGEIDYKRHTVFDNGVNQICLTKYNI